MQHKPGLKSISDPLILNNHATSSSIVTTIAFCFFFSNSCRTLATLSRWDCPEYFSSRWKTLFEGLGGRSLPHAMSTRFSGMETKEDSFAESCLLRESASAGEWRDQLLASTEGFLARTRRDQRRINPNLCLGLQILHQKLLTNAEEERIIHTLCKNSCHVGTSKSPNQRTELGFVARCEKTDQEAPASSVSNSCSKIEFIPNKRKRYVYLLIKLFCSLEEVPAIREQESFVEGDDRTT